MGMPCSTPAEVLAMKHSTALNATAIAEALERRGWDVTVAGEVRARLEDALGVWSLAIDPSGRLRFTCTRLVSQPQSRRFQRANRRYRLLLEAHSVLTVTTKLVSVDDVPAVLDQLAQFAMGGDL